MKYYLFYLKKTNDLYAFTSVKEYAKRFLEERNKDCFNVRKIRIDDEEEEKRFLYFNHEKMIGKYPYQTGDIVNDYVELMATQEEETRMDQEIDKFEREIQHMEFVLTNLLDLKDKYETSIRNMIDIYDNTGHILIDVLSLFVDLNKDTFISS